MRATSAAVVFAMLFVPEMASADVRWIQTTINGVPFAHKLDSDRASYIMFRTTTSGTVVSWFESGRTVSITDLDDINWVRAQPSKGDWIRVEWVNDQGVPTPNKAVEKYWRWSNIRTVRHTKSASAEYVEMWHDTQDTNKPTNIKVVEPSHVKLVLERAGLK